MPHFIGSQKKQKPQLFSPFHKFMKLSLYAVYDASDSRHQIIPMGLSVSMKPSKSLLMFLIRPNMTKAKIDKEFHVFRTFIK